MTNAVPEGAPQQRDDVAARLDVLLRLGAVLLPGEQTGPRLEAALQSLLPELGDWCGLLLVDPPATAPDRAVAHVDATRRDAVARWLMHRALEPTRGMARVMVTGMPLLLQSEQAIRDARLSASEDGDAALVEAGAGSVIVVPLSSRDQVLGALAVGRAPGASLRDADVAVAAEVGRRLCAGLLHDALLLRNSVATRARDEFLAQLSHELRTPLTAMIGWARMLRMRALDEERRKEGLDSLERSAVMQAQLIENLLEVSRIVSGRVTLNRQRVDVNTLAQAAASVVRGMAESRGVTMTVQGAPSPAWVDADHDRLQQVLWNLLQNALKFTPSGGHILLDVAQQERRVVIRVVDDGKGMDPDELSLVFDRFRLNTFEDGKPVAGLGLGLGVVRYLVEMHGGRVAVHSDGVGKGATFTVSLPEAS